MESDRAAEGDDLQKAVEYAMGPALVETEIRTAIYYCFAMMPARRRTSADVEIEIRRIVERAIKDMQEDGRVFDFAP
jgi:hypothetical protein